MSRMSDRASALAHPLLRLLTVLNLLYATALGLLLAASFFIEGWPQRPLGDFASLHPWLPMGVRLIVLIGIIGAAIVHPALRRLVAIVESVRSGDPFVMDNARRIEGLAWAVLALEVLHLLVGWISAVVWAPGRLGGFSFAPWLAVLMLFVLSGVFAHGARMRADLEGTV